MLPRLSDAIVIRNIIGSSNPGKLLSFSPRLISQNMRAFIRVISEMPERGRFGSTAIQVKTLPPWILSLWLEHVMRGGQLKRWSAEDLLGRSPLGAENRLDFAILGLTCRDIGMLDSTEIFPVIMFYQHELKHLKNLRDGLSFSMNLRACVMDKVQDYLKIKAGQLNLTQEQDSSTNNLVLLDKGEVQALGGMFFFTFWVNFGYCRKSVTRTPNQVHK